MSDHIEVRGGAFGLAVSLEELEQAARVLESVGHDVGDTALDIARVGSEPALLLTGLVAPVELAAAESAVLGCAGLRGAAGLGADVRTTAEVTAAAVTLYREGEEAAESLFDATATTVGVAVGAVAVPVALGTGLVVGVGAAHLLGLPSTAAVAITVGLGLGQDVDELLLENPWLVPTAADGLDGVLLGLGLGFPALGTWMAWRSGRLGVAYPPRTEQEALAVVLAATKGVALDESGRAVTVEAHERRTGRAPRSVRDLVAPDGPTSGGDRVRVTGIPRPDGSWTWVVDVPGTQTFAAGAGDNPWDLTSNVLLMAGRQTLTMRAVTQALADAQARTGSTGHSRVMLTGHSQGGITAAALAADSRFRQRFGVTHVVTSGAPIARTDVPDDVTVLGLEHQEDPVPGLDGADNPDRAGWVTVEREVGDVLGDHGGATDAHGLHHYARTADLVDASDDPSLVAWREGAQDFLDGEGGAAVVIDYDIERVEPAADASGSPAAGPSVAGSHP